MIVLTLPGLPISTNAMYANRLKGRFKSARYMTWCNAMGWEIKAQKQAPIPGWYTLTIGLHEADNRRRDPDNAVKAVSDLLVSHGLVEDDSRCVSLHVERYRAEKPKTTVIVCPSNGIAQEAA